MARNVTVQGGCGAIIGVLLALFVLGLFGAWIAMVLVGAALSYREWGFPNPSYWETFFGVWVLSIIGTLLFKGGSK